MQRQRMINLMVALGLGIFGVIMTKVYLDQQRRALPAHLRGRADLWRHGEPHHRPDRFCSRTRLQALDTALERRSCQRAHGLRITDHIIDASCEKFIKH